MLFDRSLLDLVVESVSLFCNFSDFVTILSSFIVKLLDNRGKSGYERLELLLFRRLPINTRLQLLNLTFVVVPLVVHLKGNIVLTRLLTHLLE